jgi:hypothetical protein
MIEINLLFFLGVIMFALYRPLFFSVERWVEIKNFLNLPEGVKGMKVTEMRETGVNKKLYYFLIEQSLMEVVHYLVCIVGIFISEFSLLFGFMLITKVANSFLMKELKDIFSLKARYIIDVVEHTILFLIFVFKLFF